VGERKGGRGGRNPGGAGAEAAFSQVRDRSTRRSTRRLGRESGVVSSGGEGIVASEVAALVKEATGLVGLIGEVTGGWGPAVRYLYRPGAVCGGDRT